MTPACRGRSVKCGGAGVNTPSGQARKWSGSSRSSNLPRLQRTRRPAAESYALFGRVIMSPRYSLYAYRTVRTQDTLVPKGMHETLQTLGQSHLKHTWVIGTHHTHDRNCPDTSVRMLWVQSVSWVQSVLGPSVRFPNAIETVEQSTSPYTRWSFNEGV